MLTGLLREKEAAEEEGRGAERVGRWGDDAYQASGVPAYLARASSKRWWAAWLVFITMILTCE